MKSIWQKGGLQKIWDLSRKVKQPWSVGGALAKEAEAEAHSLIVPSFLTNDDGAVQQFARAFGAQQIFTHGIDWAEAQPTEDWRPAQVAAWALFMPFAPRTWDWIQTKGEGTERLYWKETGAWGQGDFGLQATERATKQLQSVGRAWSALGHLMMALHDKRPVTPALVCDALDGINANASERNPHAMDSYHVQEAFQDVPSGVPPYVPRICQGRVCQAATRSRPARLA